MAHLVHVVVATPAHSTVGGPLSYWSEASLPAGALVRVPLGRREVCGVVWDPPEGEAAQPDPAQLRPVGAVLDGLPPLSATWRQLVTFAAGYYQRSLGEVALAALPPQLRELDAAQLARRLQRTPVAPEVATVAAAPELTDDQSRALAAIAAEPGPFLLFGATGSGKTEVYQRAVQALLERDPQAQALVLVPEINLTPQLQARFEDRFGTSAVVALHSGMTNPQRLKSWIAAHLGRARIVLGTRMAVFASLPRLGLIVVDEEHDPSYKQHEGARYSARDLAVYRARTEGAKVVLGSATPSLESWQACERGRYRCLEMPKRIGAGELPRVRLVNMNNQPRGTVFSAPLLAALSERVARGEQALVFLNRRGYAPVLACNACDWKSECSHCSAYRVFHKVDRTLRCHHCGFTERVPRACPHCGNVDIAPLGRGTERLEEQLGELLAEVRRPDGEPVRIARMDADSTRLKGALEHQLAQVHAGEVDVLVGTQMVTKGHDFRRITLVAAVNPDGALYSSDFRAPERLFGLLMQAAGRGGRDAARAAASEMWVQTFSPEHPLFAALKKHDYAAFAGQQLNERRQAAMPPFAYQALLRADARTQEIAQAFLQAAAEAAPGLDGSGHVVLYAPVPLTVQRVANVERAQLLLESGSRPALQAFLAAWQPVLQGLRVRGLIRWAIDVDPLLI
ncbi:primosomal protein N' [Ramlibacter monticola]|uniref:Replication restart protein PriA n=1 Tax=Ramlibacter monticola TaxID=1926872 RepID=A0A936Z1G2_9BURK|nr:primosomal protein N' [Ramlibacter monticola]MBL0391822.1 primosomal protein N' [Ramlibacter monticola]